MLEMHIFSVGRNEGHSVRIKLPVAFQKELPLINQVVETFEPGRDQNAVSPIMPSSEVEVCDKRRRLRLLRGCF